MIKKNFLGNKKMTDQPAMPARQGQRQIDENYVTNLIHANRMRFNVLREERNDDDEVLVSLWKEILDLKEWRRELIEENKNKKKWVNNEEELKFLVTFTANEDNKDLSKDNAMKCLNKCVKSKKQNVLKYYGALEYTKQNRIHAHLCIVYERKENKEGWNKSFFKKCSGWTYGTIDVKRIEYDNGVCTYIKKDQGSENPLPSIGEPF